MDSTEKQSLIKLDWKALVLGIVLTIILGVGLGFVLPSLAGIISIIVACLIAGYMAKGHVMNGAIHGAFIGAVIGIINILIVFFKTGQLHSNILMILLIALIGDISLGIIGGTAGNLINMFTERGSENS